jgi:glutamate-ammonia-ligase adenylyltransferase
MPTGAESGLPQQMMVLAMGKQGGGELNVSSDIDLIFVYPEDGETAVGAGQRQLSNHEFFTRLGKKLIAALSEVIEDGFVFRVDMALRPNGASGPLVASLAMVEEYLIVQGREWERYAWVKARAVTGTAADIAALDGIVRPFVFRRYLDFGVIDAIRNMHAQIRAEVDRQERLHPDRSNNVKLGRGGIREIEFLAQVFQLIRGGRDAALRERSTRATLRVLAESPAFARRRWRDCSIPTPSCATSNTACNTSTTPRPTPCRPATPTAWRWPHDGPARHRRAAGRLEAHRAFVAAQFDAIFSDKPMAARRRRAVDPHSRRMRRPRQPGRDRGAPGRARLRQARRGRQRLMATWQSPRMQSLPEASRTRLLALVNAALPLIAKAALEASGGSHSATLGRLLDFFEAIARRSAYLSLLTEYPHTLERVIRMMYASGWAATFLSQHPILLDELLDDRVRDAAPDCPALAGRTAAAAGRGRGRHRAPDGHPARSPPCPAVPAAGPGPGRRAHGRAPGRLPVGAGRHHRRGHGAGRLADDRHAPPPVPKFAVIAYGKLGGKELGYMSDLDVIFLFDDDDQDAPGNYAKLAQRFITWMTAHTSAGILFDIDTALRPDGASGMLVSSVAAFERYQNDAAWVWEHQALTRARFCAGDAAIGARFEAIREAVLRRERQRRRRGCAASEEVLKMREDARRAPEPQRAVRPQAGSGRHDRHRVHRAVPGAAPRGGQYPQLTANTGNIALLRECGALGLIDAAWPRQRRRLPRDAQAAAPAAPAGPGQCAGRAGAGGGAYGGGAAAVGELVFLKNRKRG